jgi:hypothetical protein
MRIFGLTMLLALGCSVSAAAAENTLVRCETGRARAAGPSGGPALVANVPSSMTPIDINAVLFTDKKLSKNVVVETVQAMRVPSQDLKIFARFVNCSKNNLTVQVRTNFLNANQGPAEPATPWRTLFLSPKATSGYEDISISGAKVSAFLIELRQGQ